MFYRVVMVTNDPPSGMVWIDGGDVELGQAGIATPVHTNFISGFWIDEMEVTRAKWTQVYNWSAGRGYGLYSGAGKATNHPVVGVDWYDAVKWCNARSEMEGLTPCYYVDATHSTLYRSGRLNINNGWVNWAANGYRVPTEAEWEKAARGCRQGRLFPWGGDTIRHAWANYFATNSLNYDLSPTLGYHPLSNDGTSIYTSSAGSLPANGYGLHDIAGNVFEWCWDWLGAYAATYQSDPQGPANGVFRAVRGGAWSHQADYARCASRQLTIPMDVGQSFVGLRCVRRP